MTLVFKGEESSEKKITVYVGNRESLNALREQEKADH